MEDGTRWSSNLGGELAKDGRKISVGDCALFQAINAPPFIGIIRSLSADAEGNAKLGVNWLYRPPDVKLGKGVLVEAAPNEIFYSFHRDEIPATSLLHPCKVAFLRKGVELPSGVSSFVCRRVYDTAGKCLWWLTDRDYSDEHQEEVDQLLNRTRHEMQAALQSGGPSPRALNAHVSSQQLKSGTENIHNAACFAQDKANKRECNDQNLDHVKKERSSKPDDVDAVPLKWEHTARPGEITAITDMDGSLMSSAGVERLVHLMQQDLHDSMKRGNELASWRTMIVGVIANTDQDDCLSLFVQLGGLVIMDDWLQVAHKGKGGEGGSPKEGDKIDEELLLILLRALEKLPVDLNALKQCNVGKSVNHLRNHKNVEIKKRARCLVDAWKKRVAAEMKNSDTNCGSTQCISWPCKQALGEEIHLQCKGGGAAETILKSSLPLSSGIKPISGRSGHGDIMENSMSAPSGSLKVSSLSPSTHSSKDSLTKVPPSSGIADLSVTVVKEDKSSSSSQSQNNSHSGSSWPGKAAGSAWREEPKNSTGLTTAKDSSTVPSYTSSSKSILGSGMSGNQKETEGGKTSVQNKITVGETASHSGLTPIKGVDSGCGDNVASQRLIIRLPNPGQSLICGLPEEHDADNVFHTNADPDIKTELRQNMYTKSGVAGRDDRGRSTSPLEVEGCSRDCQEAGKPMEICKMDQPSLSRLGKQIDPEEVLVETNNIELSVQDGIPSGLIKGCSKTSQSAEASVDEDGMNLPECGARSENSKVGQVLVAGNSERASFPTGEGDFYQETKLRWSTEASFLQLDNNAVDDSTVCVKKEKDDAVFRDDPDAASGYMSPSTSAFGLGAQYKDGSGLPTRAVISTQNTNLDTNAPLGGLDMNPSGEGSLSEHNSAGNGIEACPSSNQEASEEVTFGSGGKLNVAVKDEIADALTELITAEPFSGQEARDKKQPWLDTNSMVAEKDKQDVDASLGDAIKEEDIAGGEKTVVDHSMGTRTLDSDVKNMTKGIAEFNEDLKEVELQFAKKVDQNVGQGGKPLGGTSSHKGDLDIRDSHQHQNDVVKDNKAVDAKRHCNSGDEIKDRQKAENPGCQDLLDDQEILTDKKEDTVAEKAAEPEAAKEVEQASYISVSAGGKIVATVSGPGSAHGGCEEERRSDIDENEFSRFPSKFDICMVGPTVDKSLVSLTQSIENLSGESAHSVELDAAEHLAREVTMYTEGSTIGSDVAIRPEFDLNEGIAMDEANQDEATIYAAASASPVLLPTNTASNTTISSGLTTPIAVVAVTKGPFIPLVNPLQSKVELGWKGSAATSAFRPAEPQRTLERQHLTSESELVDAESDVMEKQSRPHLDIDLNVTDKIVVEDVGIASPLLLSQKSVPVAGSERMVICSQELMVSTGDQSAFSGSLCSAGRLSFDLNCVDECEENGLITAPVARSLDNLASSFKTVSSGSSRILRDFDLNDGPSFEDARDGHTSQEFNAGINGSSSVQDVAGTKENEELVNVSSWFPHESTFSALAIPLSSARIEQPFRVGAAAAVQSISSSAGGPVSFSGDLYKREPALASARSVPYSKSVTAPFPYAGSPFGLNVPLTSTPPGGTSVSDSSGLACFPAVSAECAGAVSSAYPRPYLLNLTNSSGIVNSNTWRTQDFDLNAGPETVDMEGREAIASKHPFTTDSQVSLEHKGAFFPAATSGVSLKRKEPEGGWDLCKTGYRQSTWQ